MFNSKTVEIAVILIGVIALASTGWAQINTVIEIGQTQTGQLEATDQTLEFGEFVDTYQFTGSAAQIIEINLSSTDFDTFLMLTNDSGFQADNDDVEPGNFNSRLVVTLPQDGQYSIGVTSYAPGEMGAYTFSVAEGSVEETTQTIIEVGQSVVGQLEFGDGQLISGEYQDVYQFIATAGQALQISLTSSEFDTYLMVGNDLGFQLVNNNADPSGTDSRVVATPPVDGLYTIYVTSNAVTEVGSYTLTIEVWTTDLSVEPGTVQIDVPITGQLQVGDTTLASGEFADSYTFSGVEAATLVVRLTSNDFDTYLSINGPEGFTQFNDDAVGSNSEIRFTVPTTGEYEILVTSFAPSEIGTYNLSIVPAESVAVTLTYTPLAAGENTAGVLEATDDRLVSGEYVDYFSYVGVEGQRVVISVNSMDFDTYLMLRATGFTLDNDDISPQDFNSQIVASLPSDGEYAIGVTSYVPGEVGAYQLILEENEQVDVAAIVIESGQTVEGLLDGEDQMRPGGQFYDVYSFDGEAGQQVSVSLSSAQLDTLVFLNGPNAFQSQHDDIDLGAGNTNSLLEVGLPTDGTYEIWASTYDAGTTGPYTISLTVTE